MTEKTRVLLVDDDSSYLNSLVPFLRLLARRVEGEIEFVTAPDSAEAMKILEAAHEANQDFLFVFSDNDMVREGEGFEFGAELYQLDWAKGILFFVITGRTEVELESQIKLGVQKVIKKGADTPQKILEEITLKLKDE